MFLIKCSILDIRSGSEYALISEYTRDQNILGFWIYQGYRRFWIKYFVIDLWQYSEYALDSEYDTVLNILRSHRVMNKIFHQKYLTGFWISFEFWKYQYFTGFCKKQPPYILDRFLSIPWAVSLPGVEYRRVVNMPRLHMILHKLYFKDSHYFEYLELWIC